MKSKETVTFSTNMHKETKDLLERFCKSRGLRMNHLVEKAILLFIEDEMDKMIIEDREFEETVEWKQRA